MQWSRGTFTVTSDPTRVDVSLVADFLASAYWSEGIPPATVVRSLENSLCFVLMDGEHQIGFARVVSDYATIAYIGDVFVVPPYRNQGLGKWLMECVMSHPDLRGLRRWMLATRDAHGLYERFGFTSLEKPDIFMERHDPEVYRRGT